MSEQPEILIFGAGINQLELIRETRLLGFKSIVIDPQTDPPGKREADFFYRVDGADYETTRTIAVDHKVRGIVTGQMEKPLRLMARLATDLGLIFTSPGVTERCLDKWLMKDAFQSGSIPCARGVLIRSDEEIPASLPENMSFPVIIKPRDAFSSRGVYKCETPDEVMSHRKEAQSYASEGDILIEEFIEGKEYSVEAISFQGETTIVQFTEKFITPYPNTVETGHLQPADLTEEEKESISLVVKEAIKVLGIENSATHTEVMMTKAGPKIIETGARTGGDFIGSYLTRSSTGVSMDRAVVQVALGIKPDLRHKYSRYAMIRYPELPAGRIVSEVRSTEDITSLPGVVLACVSVRPGDKIMPLKHSGVRPACILAEAADKEKLLADIEKYSSILTERIVLT